MSVAAIENASPQLTQIATDAELQSECIADEAECPIMAAQIGEEFRRFLLVIALCPQSPRLTSFGSIEDSTGPYLMHTEPH